MHFYERTSKLLGRPTAPYDRGRARERSARRYVDRTLSETGVRYQTRQETGARVLRPEENED